MLCYRWVLIYDLLEDRHIDDVAINSLHPNISIYVVGQFFPWFKFSFPLFQTHYHTLQLTIGSYVSVHSSRYEARRKFGEHKR